MKDPNRRKFLRDAGIIGAGLTLSACTREDRQPLPTPKAELITPTTAPEKSVEQTEKTQEVDIKDYAGLAVARGTDIPEMVRRTIAALGGMERYIKNGYDVIIKPNICTDYYPFEYGATTNPIVAGTLVSMAFAAGAKRVRVMDNPFGGTPQSAYAKSGIQEAVEDAGGEMEVMNQNKFLKADIPDGLDLKEWIVNVCQSADASTVIHCQ